MASVIIPILSNDVNVLGFSLSRIKNLSARKRMSLARDDAACGKPDARLHIAVWLGRNSLRMQGYRKVLAAHAPEEK